MEDSVGQRAVGDLETFLASEKFSGRQLSPIKLRLEDMIKGMINISINADDIEPRFINVAQGLSINFQTRDIWTWTV